MATPEIPVTRAHLVDNSTPYLEPDVLGESAVLRRFTGLLRHRQRGSPRRPRGHVAGRVLRKSVARQRQSVVNDYLSGGRASTKLGASSKQSTDSALRRISDNLGSLTVVVLPNDAVTDVLHFEERLPELRSLAATSPEFRAE